MECLKQHGQDSEACRDLAKSYLKCRMERCGSGGGWRITAGMDGRRRLLCLLLLAAFISWWLTQHTLPSHLCPSTQCSNLMAKQDLRDLGFAEGEGPTPAPKPKPKDEQPKRRIETEGYLAGMKRFED